MKTKTCRWEFSVFLALLKTSCKKVYSRVPPCDSTGFKFCPYCGLKIKEVKGK